jgi:imidazolonepropionase-like amidohydrolase
MKRNMALFFIVIVSSFFAVQPAFAQKNQQSTTNVLISNVNIFDGKNKKLLKDMDVLVEGNLIKQIAQDIKAPKGAEVIEGNGKTLMPGLIDNHWHTMLSFWPVSKILNADLAHLGITAGHLSGKTLLRGFTSVRDIGGNSFGVKKAIDEGTIFGPRIYASGPTISQTSGHGDFMAPNAVPSNPNQALDYTQRTGHTLIADGVPEVTKRTREALRMGATQIKVMAGGGVTSLYDPLDVTQYTFEEAKAIVDVAKTWNTYVAIHANTDDAIQMWIKAGAKSVEHAFLITEETAKLMAKKGVWFSMQPILNDEDAIKFEDPISTAKYITVTDGLDNAIALAKKYKLKIAFGTDVLFDAALAEKHGKLLAKLKRWYTPYEILKMATSNNAELLKMCGPRDPYPGKLGVIEEGALADMLLVDGNPLENIDLVADADKNFVVIMKDGKIYKNTLH